MRTATKVSAYALALAAVFGGTWAAGAATGPVGAQPTGPTGAMGHDADTSCDTTGPAGGHDGGGSSAGSGHDAGAGAPVAPGGSAEGAGRGPEAAGVGDPASGGHDGVATGSGGPARPSGCDSSTARSGDFHAADHGLLPGLSAAANGYQLDVSQTTVATGTSAPFTFRVLGPDGTAIHAFDTAHEKQLHFIVVRRDGSNYQHLHPVMATDGTWTVPLRLAAAGSYRLLADFAPTGGTPTTLGTDIQAAGAYEPAPDTGPVRTATVDGYDVTLTGDLRAGRSSTVVATVRHNGQVTGLEPYLGAYGHLVALRASDLGYLHVHPLERTGPEVRFAVEVPTTGRYRLYLDFQHDGVVRTAAFTVDTGR
ncbi:hypothetical protein GCM10029964_049410 [Kibdelosporangium lantanae]